MNDNEQIDLSDETIEHSSSIASLIMEGIFKREEDNYNPGACNIQSVYKLYTSSALDGVDYPRIGQ